MNKQIKLSCLFIVIGLCILGILYIITLPVMGEWFTQDELKKYSFQNENIVIVIPTLTANAYAQNGFYDYYNKKCDETCLSIQINKYPEYTYESSKNLFKAFRMLNASMITDYALNQNLAILDQYERVVIMHNEYVTKELFDKITSHKDVIYLHPNALYAEVKIENQTMTLVRGHNYPTTDITNGFNWKYDNSHLEKDNVCTDYTWNKIDNGYQLSCYPEKEILRYKEIFSFIKGDPVLRLK